MVTIASLTEAVVKHAKEVGLTKEVVVIVASPTKAAVIHAVLLWLKKLW